MSKVIEVSELSKQYRLGTQEQQSKTFVESLYNTIKAPFTNYKKIRDLSRQGPDGDNVFWALKDVSFDIEAGEVVGIIGRNGAGKSTLLKILSRITEPTRGEVKIKGRIASLLEVGTGFHPELSGRENVYMNGTILGMTKKEIDKQFDEIVEFSGVEKFIDTPVKFYSSGMKVRLGFAVAAHLEPEILIIDEVLAVGDVEFQRKCLGKMKDVSQGQGRTVLFVSHNLSSIQQLCSRGIVLNEGALTFQGEIETACQLYRSSVDSEFRENHYFEKSGDQTRPASILNARLTTDDGVSTSQYAFDDEIIITLKYQVNQRLRGSMVNFIISDTTQQLMMSFDSDRNLHVFEDRESGVYVTQAKIPSKRLKPGIYEISVGIGIAGKVAIEQLERCLSFEVYSKEKTYPHASYHKDRIGVLPLVIDWETKLLEN